MIFSGQSTRCPVFYFVHSPGTYLGIISVVSRGYIKTTLPIPPRPHVTLEYFVLQIEKHQYRGNKFFTYL